MSVNTNATHSVILTVDLPVVCFSQSIVKYSCGLLQPINCQVFLWSTSANQLSSIPVVYFTSANHSIPPFCNKYNFHTSIFIANTDTCNTLHYTSLTQIQKENRDHRDNSGLGTRLFINANSTGLSVLYCT